MLILGVGVVLLTTIALVLMMFISIPYDLPAFLLHLIILEGQLGRNTAVLCHLHILGCRVLCHLL